MKPAIILASLAVTGCAEWQAGLEAAARYKAAANDAQARIWEAGACDLSLGGLDQLPAAMQRLLLAHCVTVEMCPAIESPRTISPAGARWQLHSTPAPALPVPFDGIGE